ncbi:MAG: hypothetical protein ACRDHN_18415 [Thermomicrobiales bacterium]
MLALAIPAGGLAPDAMARIDWRAMIQATGIQPTGWVWQHNTHLFMLERNESGQWVVAELEFLRDRGYYIELRRCSYDWPREATGAMLSRLLSLGDCEAFEASVALDAWCTVTFAVEVSDPMFAG